MTKECLEQLYGFTTKLMPLLGDEIDMLEGEGGKSSVDVKRDITRTLSELAGLIVKMNKIRKEEVPENLGDVGAHDQAIIERFLQKQKS